MLAIWEGGFLQPQTSPPIHLFANTKLVLCSPQVRSVVKFIFKCLTQGEYTEIKESYEDNNAGCYAVEGMYCGKRYVFDATLRLNQFGRYINHSRTPNLRYTPVYNVRGKLRFGFISKEFIPAGCQLFWNYGDVQTDIDWLKGYNCPASFC